MNKKTKDVLKIIIVFFFYFNMGTIFKYILKIFNIDMLNFDNIGIAIMELIVQTVLFLIIFLIYKKRALKDQEKFNINLKENLILCLKLFLMLLLVKFISAYITALISGLLKIPIETSENQMIVTALLKASPIAMFIASVFLAPFTEEMIFRLGLKKLIKNDLIFIIVSGLFFGLIHVFPTSINLTLALMQSITYVSMGCLLAYYYVKYDNIYIVIILHALNNLLGLLATFILF